jgi:hypothetical protein
MDEFFGLSLDAPDAGIDSSQERIAGNDYRDNWKVLRPALLMLSGTSRWIRAQFSASQTDAGVS